MFQPRLLILPLTAAFLTACVVAPYPARRVGYPQPVPSYPQQQPGYGYGQPVPGDYGDDIVVDVAPPAPYVEIVPRIPFAGALWIGGHWGWGGNRHAWVPGRWEQPRPGYGWRPHAWVPQRGQWHLRGGGWVRR